MKIEGKKIRGRADGTGRPDVLALNFLTFRRRPNTVFAGPRSPVRLIRDQSKSGQIKVNQSSVHSVAIHSVAKTSAHRLSVQPRPRSECPISSGDSIAFRPLQMVNQGKSGQIKVNQASSHSVAIHSLAKTSAHRVSVQPQPRAECPIPWGDSIIFRPLQMANQGKSGQIKVHQASSHSVACGGRNESGRKSGWRNWCDFLRLLPLRSPTIIFFRAAVAAIPCIDAGVVRSNRRAIAAICRSTFKSAKRSKPTNSALARASARCCHSAASPFGRTRVTTLVHTSRKAAKPSSRQRRPPKASRRINCGVMCRNGSPLNQAERRGGPAARTPYRGVMSAH